MVTYSNDPEYADRYVAFLDILGFSDLTKKAHKDLNWRSFLRKLIIELRDTFPAAVAHSNFRFVNFSDSIVMSARMNRDGLGVIIRSATIVMSNMLSRGILLRGGIAGGNLHHDDQLMFGPALLDAYEFEKRGGPPHISLHEQVVAAMQPGLWDISILDHVVPDPWDLTPMLHTLYEFEHYDGIPREGAMVLDMQAVQLAAGISARANDMNEPPAVRAKWRWMQDYWNRSVATKGILQRAEPCEDWSKLLESAKRRSRRRTEKFNAERRANGDSAGAAGGCR